jgi:hypothetical protein
MTTDYKKREIVNLKDGRIAEIQKVSFATKDSYKVWILNQPGVAEDIIHEDEIVK